MGPVTPTMTRGCAEKREKMTQAMTEERRTSLTPYELCVLVNMSREKARAGRMLVKRLVFTSARSR